jgi:hypothetical protein
MYVSEVAKAYRQKIKNDRELLERKRESQRKYERKPERIAAMQARYNRFRAFLNGYKSFATCIDCGEFDSTKLEFDHVRGKKRFKVSINAHFSFVRLVAEIEKCEVRCNACHKARHRLDGYTHLPLGEDHHATRITLEQAKYILAEKNNRVGRVLARRFSISPSTVSAIQTGRSWKQLHSMAA